MSLAVFHLKKINGKGLGGVRNHMMRTGKSRTNEDISAELRENNSFIEKDAAHLEKRISERIKSLNIEHVRKDAVRLVDVVCGSSYEGMSDMSKEKQDAYFNACVQFLKSRFGQENFLYACVHRDEEYTAADGSKKITPHLHFGFMPVHADENGKAHLSAKTILTRASLRKLQDDFYENVAKKFGFEKSEKKQQRGHIETKDWKEAVKESDKLIKKLDEHIDKKLFSNDRVIDKNGFGLLNRMLGKMRSDAAELIVERKRADAVEYRARNLEYELNREYESNRCLRKKLSDLREYAADYLAFVDSQPAQKAALDGALRRSRESHEQRERERQAEKLRTQMQEQQTNLKHGFAR